jgi:hypothetical protein
MKNNKKLSQISNLEQFKLSLAHKCSCGNLADLSSAGKAPEDWRTPRRFAYFRNHRVARSVLDCGGPPPLLPEAYQTVPMLTGTAICWRFFVHCSGLSLVTSAATQKLFTV